MKNHFAFVISIYLILITTQIAQAQVSTLDNTFGTGGRVITDFFGGSAQSAYGVCIQGDGKIVVVGSYTGTTTNAAIVRYNYNGTLDSTFGINGIADPNMLTNRIQLRSLAIQNDGKILVAGANIGIIHENFVVLRYNSTGTLDTTFGSGGKITTTIGNGYSRALSLAIQVDGKIVAVGYYGTSNLSACAVVRYNKDGTLDNTFGTGGKTTTTIGTYFMGASVAIQNDGKIVVVGRSDDGNNLVAEIIRYKTDGTLDSTFGNGGMGTKIMGSFFSVAIQPDGKIVAGGGVGGVFFIVARYNTSGTLDTSFHAIGYVTTKINGNNDGSSLALQTDGKIVFAGSTSNGSNIDFGVVRYNSNGSLDDTFWSRSFGYLGFDDYAHSLALQKDGKIVVAGQAENNGSSAFQIIRINGDSSCLANYKTSYDSISNTFTSIVDPITSAMAIKYNWDFGDGSPSSSLSAPSHIYTVDTVYNLCMKIYTALGDSCTYCRIIGKDYLGNIYRNPGFKLNVKNANTTSIYQINEQKFTTNIAPNPFSSKTNISFSEEQKNTTIKITDMLGNVIKSEKVKGNNITIDMSGNAKGVYLVRMEDENKNLICRKIVLQ